MYDTTICQLLDREVSVRTSTSHRRPSSPSDKAAEADRQRLTDRGANGVPGRPTALPTNQQEDGRRSVGSIRQAEARLDRWSATTTADIEVEGDQ